MFLALCFCKKNHVHKEILLNAAKNLTDPQICKENHTDTPEIFF